MSNSHMFSSCSQAYVLAHNTSTERQLLHTTLLTTVSTAWPSKKCWTAHNWVKA